MLIVFSCGNCGRKFEKDESLAGKKGRGARTAGMFS